jgi:type I restriction enzyme S subunit
MISELDKVPIGWEKVKFGDIAQNVTDRIDNPKESGLKDYIGLEHLDTDEIRIRRYGLPDEVEATKFLCRKGDIIFGKRRAYLRKLAVTSRDAVVSAHSMVLRPKEEKIISDFLPWFMQSSQFWKTAFAISEGSLSPTIKWKTLSAQEFWIPSRTEQKKIAEILWSIESSIEKLEQLIQVTEKLKKGMIEKIITKGIGHKQFKESELGEIPEEWEISSFPKAIEVNPTRKLKVGSKYSKVEMADIEEWNPRIMHSEKVVFNGGGSKFKNEDVLLARITPCLENGKTVFVDILEENEFGFGSTEFIVLSGRQGIALGKFAYYLCTSPMFRQLAIDSMTGTTGRQRVPNDFFDAIKIPLPPISEQKRIVEILDNFARVFLSYNSLLGNWRKLEKKITNSLLSGELLTPKEALN